MKRINAAISAVLTLALALPLTSCAYVTEPASNASEGKNAEYAIEEPAAPGWEDESFYDGYATSESADIAPEESESGIGRNTSTASAPSVLESQKLIYSASVSLDTTDFDKSVDALRNLMASCDAFAEYEDEWTYGDQELHVLKVTLRVPAENYDKLMTDIDGIEGTVTNRSSQVTNITREYADNGAIIEALEIQEDRLLEMMEKAETIEDMILVEERLSEVQAELNWARTDRSDMDSLVNLSTVSVTITEVRYGTTTAQTGYLTRVGNAFADMWDSLIEGIGDLGIALIYAIPAIVVLVVIVLLIVRAIRRYNKKHAEQFAAVKEQVEDIEEQ